jgi:hypothetical protein
MDTENITTSKKRRMRRSKNNIEKIKLKIEDDATKKVIQLNSSTNSFNNYNKPDVSNLLLNIMQTGSNEFKEKTGRNMTYLEMREMFG